MKKIAFLIVSLSFFKIQAQILLNPEVDSIVMRDGKKLAADIYLPDTLQKYPVILIQTPYNRLFYRASLPLGIGKNLKNSPYAFVIVDWRCFYGSAKACKTMPDRGKDGYDVIDWIVKQSWSNGKVGTWGASALGKIQYQTAKEQHPNHICAVPIVAGSQMEYPEYFPNGVFRTEYVDQLDALGYNMKNSLLQHPYYDVSWQYTESANMYPDKIKIPMFLIGGWFDHNIDQMFRMFDTLLKASDPGVRDFHKFLIGPWTHNSVGKKKAGELEFPEAEGKSDSFAMLFFDYWLRGAKNGWPLLSEYLLYRMDFGNKTSCVLDKSHYWPLLSEKSTLLLHDGSLYVSYHPNIPKDLVRIHSYQYNPKNPSPTIGGPTLRTDLKQGPFSVGSLCKRTDNYFLDTIRSYGSFQTMSVNGSIDIELFVSSNRFDTDFAVRFGIIDEYKRDTIILSDGIFRMRFRNGFRTNDTSLIKPGQVYPISIKLPAIYCEIHPPYKPFLMISSSNSPRFDLNLNNGGALYQSGDTLTATNTIYTGKNYPSKIVFDGVVIASGIEDLESQIVNVYPNPAQDQIIIHLNSLSDFFNYSIIDLQGKEIMKGINQEAVTFSIDVSELKPQVYFLKLENKSNCFVKKLIKIE